jgi:hypothetical protein
MRQADYQTDGQKPLCAIAEDLPNGRMHDQKPFLNDSMGQLAGSKRVFDERIS